MADGLGDDGRVDLGQRRSVGHHSVGEPGIARDPGQGERRRTRCGRRVGVHRAVAQHADAVVGVVPALLDHGQAPAHGLPDPDGEVVLDRVKVLHQGARRQLLPDLGLCGLARRDHRRVGQAQRVVLGAVAHPEVVDRDEDPAAPGVPVGLGAASGTGEMLGEVTARVARSRLGEADDRVSRHLVGDGDREARAAGSSRPAASVTSTLEVDRAHGAFPTSRSVGRRLTAAPPLYFGAKRWPASRRMQQPLSIGFSTMATASLAYSSGRPMRLGNAASLVSTSANSSGIPLVMPVLNRLGAMARTRMPRLPRSRAIVSVMPAIPALAAVYATWPICPSNAAMDAVSMMTPRSPSSGSLAAMWEAWSRFRLKVPMRLSSMVRRNSSMGCGPSLVSVRLAVPAAGGVHRDVQTRRARPLHRPAPTRPGRRRAR